MRKAAGSKEPLVSADLTMATALIALVGLIVGAVLWALLSFQAPFGQD